MWHRLDGPSRDAGPHEMDKGTRRSRSNERSAAPFLDFSDKPARSFVMRLKIAADRVVKDEVPTGTNEEPPVLVVRSNTFVGVVTIDEDEVARSRRWLSCPRVADDH